MTVIPTARVAPALGDTVHENQSVPPASGEPAYVAQT